jgi:hypothetical protein
MKVIDARGWDPEFRAELWKGAAEGAALVQVSDAHQVVVLDLDLWNHIQATTPSPFAANGKKKSE